MRQGLRDEQLQATFIGSVEYYTFTGGTDRKWVEAMYRDLLGRSPDPAGEGFWAQALAAGAERSAVAYGFAASAERERIQVRDDYQRFLARPASDAEVAFWVNAFVSGERNEDVVAGLRREVREEAGIECAEVQLAGTISWPGFGTMVPAKQPRRSAIQCRHSCCPMRTGKGSVWRSSSTGDPLP